jgi:hypothetical protein
MLAFSGEIPWEVIKQAMAELAAQLSGEQHPWVVKSYQKLPKNFYGDDPFEEIVESPVGLLRLSAQEDGAGNPRDGWGYNLDAQLSLTKNQATISLSQSSQSSRFGSGTISVAAPELKIIEQLRQIFRKHVGPERDLSMNASNATYLIEKATKDDPDLAKQWMKEALAVGPQPYGWDILLRLAEKVLGPDPALLAQRLRETPHDESAWKQAADHLPEGFSVAQVTSMLRRFQTTIPEGAVWYRCEDGLGPTSFRGNPARQVFHKLYGFDYSCPKPTQHSASFGPKMVHMECKEDALPLVLIEQNQETPNESSLSLAWLWGIGEDDCVVFAHKKLLPTNLYLGNAVSFFGSEAFQRKVKEVLAQLLPFRWVAGTFEEMFVEHEPRVIQFVARDQSEREQVSQLLKLTRADSPEVSQLFESCQCAKIACEHTGALTHIKEKIRDEADEQEPRQAYRSRAQVAALDVLLSFLRQQKSMALLLTQAEIHLAQCAALIS